MFNITNTHVLLFTIAEVSKTEMHLGIELEDTARVTVELPLASGSCGNVMLLQAVLSSFIAYFEEGTG